MITPLFSRGAYEDIPEIRPPSIRGQLRWWFRALGYTPEMEQAIFGGLRGTPQASKVVVRVHSVQASPSTAPTLPHKSGGHAAPKACFAAGGQFAVLISSRRALEASEEAAVKRTAEVWSLAGSLGLRATRGGGCFVLERYPLSPQAFTAALGQRLNGSPVAFALLDKAYQSAEQARSDITNTIGGPPGRGTPDSLSRLNNPLGLVDRGNRKTSPLRLRVCGFNDGAFRILALWDGRGRVTGNRPGDLAGAIRELQSAQKPIGDLLARSGLARNT